MTTITIDRDLLEQALEALEWIAAQQTGGMIQRKSTEPQDALRAALAQQAEPTLTIERLRDALVASRIIPPAAVEDPDEYDDGVTLHCIKALHRRIA